MAYIYILYILYGYITTQDDLGVSSTGGYQTTGILNGEYYDEHWNFGGNFLEFTYFTLIPTDPTKIPIFEQPGCVSGISGPQMELLYHIFGNIVWGYS